jgi:hypothetical protein
MTMRLLCTTVAVAMACAMLTALLLGPLPA